MSSNTAEAPRTLETLLGYTINSAGELATRQKTADVKLDHAIKNDIEALMGRAAEPADIRYEVADFLLAKWRKNTKIRRRSLKLRLQWFERNNRIAVLLGWAEPIDFSGIDCERTYQFRMTKKNQPTKPEAAPVVDPGDCEGMQAVKLIDMLEQHYKPARLAGKSAHSTRLYKYTIRRFSLWLERPAVVADLTTDKVTRHINDLLEGTDLAAATIDKCRSQLVALWNYAAKRGWLAEWPQIQKLRVPQRVPDAWTNEEAERLLAACERQGGAIGTVPCNVFWPALVATVFDTAERIGAVMETERHGFDPSGWLTIKAEHRKGGKRDKRFKLRPSTVKRIQAVHEASPRNDRLFPFPRNYTYLFKLYGEILEDAGLPSNRRTKFHKIRRTTASNFESRGGNATELLDHESRKTTTASYLDPRVVKTLFPADIVPGIGEAESETETPVEGIAKAELQAMLQDALAKLQAE